MIEQSGRTFTGDGTLGLPRFTQMMVFSMAPTCHSASLPTERRIEFAGALSDSAMQGHYLVRIQGDSIWANTWILRRVRVIKHARPPELLSMKRE